MVTFKRSVHTASSNWLIVLCRTKHKFYSVKFIRMKMKVEMKSAGTSSVIFLFLIPTYSLFSDVYGAEIWLSPSPASCWSK